MNHIPELIIFDVDGTLYDLDDVVKSNYDIQTEFFSREMNITVKEAEEIFAQNGILPYKSDKARSATEFFLRSGLSIEEWKSYRESHFSVEVIDRSKAVSEELIEAFAEISDIVILSSNTLNNILLILKWINIDPALFRKIYCADNNPGSNPFSKTSAIEGIIAETGILPAKILSIGDRYSTDIEPLLKLGGHGLLVSGPEDLQGVYDELLFEKESI